MRRQNIRRIVLALMSGIVWGCLCAQENTALEYVWKASDESVKLCVYPKNVELGQVLRGRRAIVADMGSEVFWKKVLRQIRNELFSAETIEAFNQKEIHVWVKLFIDNKGKVLYARMMIDKEVSALLTTEQLTDIYNYFTRLDIPLRYPFAPTEYCEISVDVLDRNL